MNHPSRLFRYIRHFVLSVLLTQCAVAQGYDEPLTFQGVDHYTLHSAASRAMGGTTIGLKNDVGLMFTNPASLQSLQEIQISFGGLQQSLKSSQEQQYAPLKYYSNFSLLMEGLTGYISDPDTVTGHVPNAGDTVQRPYDNIGPNWSRSKNNGQAIQALLAVPFSVGEMRFTAGIGFVEYANLNHYYENHNVLSPDIGSERPVPVALPASDSTPVVTHWSSSLRARDGSIKGYGLALSGSLTDKFSIGLSGMILKGSSDDLEQRVERGTLVFYRSYFRLDSVYGQVAKTGTSDYSGSEFTISGIYRGRYVSLGFAIKPPTTITRKYSTETRTDSGGSSLTTAVNAEDKVKLPWRGTIGLSAQVVKNVTLALEYEIRSYATSVYKKADGTESNPWLSSSVLHLGAEYAALPWLAVRAGVRGQAEVFEPEGNPIIGDPVSYSVYSAGCGFLFGGLHLNVTYEYAKMKYQDLWQTNVNLNSEIRNTTVADIAYEIPLMR
jgi:opacity protein-like surface antigen